ncbi:MAG: hypothetical protein ABFR47_00800 [Verrucomicrobiota bacterium]
MPFEIRQDADKKCIRVTFTGALTMPLVREYVEALLPILEETDYRLLLSDCLNAEVQLSSRDIMQFPKIAAESPLTSRLRRAVLATPGTSGYELYETLSKLMGQQLRIFNTKEDAMKWLMDPATDGSAE